MYLAHVRPEDARHTESFRAMCHFDVKFLDVEITYQDDVLCFLTYDNRRIKASWGLFFG